MVGRGAGTFAASWAQRRPSAVKVQNAHSLYLETLAELGVVGLALLAGFLLVPAVAAARARRAVVFPGAVARIGRLPRPRRRRLGLAADGVTIVALLAGVSLLASARAAAHRPGRRGGVVLLPLAVAGSALALVSVLGNVPLGRSRDAVDASRWAAAAIAAHVCRAVGAVVVRAACGCSAKPTSAPVTSPAHARSFREGVRKDPESWQLWLDLALASNGAAAARGARAGAKR